MTRTLNAYISQLTAKSGSVERQSSVALKYIALALCVSLANRQWLEKLADVAVDWGASEREIVPSEKKNNDNTGGCNSQSNSAGRSPAGDNLARTPSADPARLDPCDASRASVELPSIPSDEDTEEERERQRSYAPWTRSPALGTQLEAQSREHPRRVFGDVAPVTMFGSKDRNDTRPTLSPSPARGRHGLRPINDDRNKFRPKLAPHASVKTPKKEVSHARAS